MQGSDPFDTLREYEANLIEAAKKSLKRAENGSFNEEELIASLASIVPFDVDKERRRKAHSLIARSKRPGATKSNGQLLLPGFNTARKFEPDRMVSDDFGNIIEYHRALPEFKSAAVGRAQVNVDRAVEELRALTVEMRIHQEWALEQALAGRPALDLTWGNCIAERGLHHPDTDGVAA
jgi:hypothetical protein